MQIKVKKLKDGQVELQDERGIPMVVLTKEQAKSLADVLTAATRS